MFLSSLSPFLSDFFFLLSYIFLYTACFWSNLYISTVVIRVVYSYNTAYLFVFLYIRVVNVQYVDMTISYHSYQLSRIIGYV